MPAPRARMGLQWVDSASATLQRHGEEVTISYRWPDGDGWRRAVQSRPERKR
jgi:hypothetical protein